MEWNFKILLFFIFISPSSYSQTAEAKRCKASYYANMFHGRLTSNGEIFDQGKLTAAHRSLPFGTLLKVTNVKNYKSVIVRINDRGPFVKKRCIDLSREAAKKIGMLERGVTEVLIEFLYIPPAKRDVVKEVEEN